MKHLAIYYDVEHIQYQTRFSSQHAGENLVRVSCDDCIIGGNRRQCLSHEENVRVVEEAGLVGGEPGILRTISGSQGLRQ